jgi:ATP-dependent helicase HepA
MNNQRRTQPSSAQFAAGQRWISSSEPELGLGTIISFANRRVEIAFITHHTERTFATETAPLQRIIFSPGNTIEDIDGNRHTVTSVVEDPESRLVTYHCGNVVLGEDELSDTLSFSTPEQRLMTGIADDISVFSLRREMLEHRRAIDASEIRGFAGGRIDLIPHQLFIAQQATQRSNVRILLADETGLGKTIEACLILHRMICTGQVSRVLILVPDALVHQWFVELLRRFNLHFRLLTDESFGDEEDTSSQFDDDPLWICSTTMARRHPFLPDQLSASSWDLLIIDEAHHITGKDPLFGLVEKLSVATPSVILLSATPEQFGRKGHFARLQLLDPHRYREMEDPASEAKRLHLIASCLEKQLKSHDGEPSPDTVIQLSDKLHRFLVERQALSDTQCTGSVPSELSIAHLIDLFGAGRAYFRNTRRTISGFPKRSAEMFRLTADRPNGIDPHSDWIAQFLGEHPRRKVLVITSTIESANAIRDALQKILAIDIAVFHESMTLLQRDRQAAWFAEDHGARVMICSESGSEGRNFQFCSDLVLLDIPWNPELLEQRIGRLDRIGQKHSIKIYLPVIAESTEEMLCRWYHEGVNVFEKNVPAAAVVFEEMEPRLRHLADTAYGTHIARTRTTSGATACEEDTLDKIIADTRQRVDELSRELYTHRDFLLEFASNHPRQAQHLIDMISNESLDSRAAKIMGKLFVHYGIKVEEAGSLRLALITEYCTDHSFPLPRSEHPIITYDRTTACTYDTIEFLTIDHPMVNGALDLFLSSPCGTTAFALWNDLTTTELLLESLIIVECIAPADVRLFRFFTATPVRTVVNHHLQLVTEKYPVSLLKPLLKNGPVGKLISQKQLIQVTFPKLLAASDGCIGECIAPMISQAKEKMHHAYADERDRLRQLRSQGALITDAEIECLDTEERDIDKYISDARVRRDALRLIWRGPVKGG